MFALPGLLAVTCGAVVGCVAPPGMVTVAGEMLTLDASALASVTVSPAAGAGWLVDPNPGAVAVMLAEPRLAPVTCGCVVGCVCPAAMLTVLGEMLTLPESLLERVTVTPPCGAAADSVSANGADWVNPT